MATNIPIKNSSNLTTLKIKIQSEATQVGPKTQRFDPWKDAGVDKFLPPGQTTDVWVGPGRRIVIEEMPS